MATLYLICGMAGAGKTTLARQLEKTCRALRLSPDEWIDTIIENDDNKTELDRLRELVESLQWDLAQKLLYLDTSVILENGFWSQEEREMYRKQAKDMGARVELHYLDVNSDELWRRLQNRNANLPAGSFAVTKEELKSWMRIFEPPQQGELMRYDNWCEGQGR